MDDVATLRRIETRVEQIALHVAGTDQAHAELSEKLDKLSTYLMDPNNGIIVQVNSHTAWINAQRSYVKGLISVGGSALLVGVLAWIVNAVTHGTININR